jgi:hypothetical protein
VQQPVEEKLARFQKRRNASQRTGQRNRCAIID